MRRTIVVLLALGLAGTALAQAEPAHLQPPIEATSSVSLDAEAGTVLVEEGSATMATSARSGSLVVWEERTPCFEGNRDQCFEGRSETTRRSISLESASLTLTPREDAEHVSVLSTEDGRMALSAGGADVGLRSEARTVELAQNSEAPREHRVAELPRGLAVPTQEDSQTNLSLEGSITLQTTGSIVKVENTSNRMDNGSSSDDEEIVTGVTWESGQDGFDDRVLRLVRADLDGALAGAWDGSLVASPQLPTSLAASEATVTVVEGQLGEANASTGPTELTDLEATLTGIVWSQDDSGQIVAEQGAQPVANADPPAEEGEGLSATEAVGAGSAAATAVLLTAYYWPRVSWLATVAVLPLYSRIEKDELFENDTREQLYEVIKDDPGIHAHALAEEVDIGWGTTVYHLRRLERNGFVQSEKRGRYRRFFPASGFVERHREALSVLQNETTSDIAELVREEPGLNQSAICDELDISPSLANWHLNRLIDAELVDRERKGRTVHYSPGEAWEGLEQLAEIDSQEIPDAQAA